MDTDGIKDGEVALKEGEETMVIFDKQTKVTLHVFFKNQIIDIQYSYRG